MDTIITLNLRGKKRQYYKSLLIKIPYFGCLLGESSFEPTKPNNDGSYFVDCDVDAFENIISYVETGELKMFSFGKTYTANQFGKFGLEYNDKIHNKKVKERAIQKYIDFFDNILTYLKENEEIIIKFQNSKTCEQRYIFDPDTNELICVFNSDEYSSLYRLKNYENFKYEWNEHMTQKVEIRRIGYTLNQIGIKLIKN